MKITDTASPMGGILHQPHFHRAVETQDGLVAVRKCVVTQFEKERALSVPKGTVHRERGGQAATKT